MVDVIWWNITDDSHTGDVVCEEVHKTDDSYTGNVVCKEVQRTDDSHMGDVVWGKYWEYLYEVETSDSHTGGVALSIRIKSR